MLIVMAPLLWNGVLYSFLSAHLKVLSSVFLLSLNIVPDLGKADCPRRERILRLLRLLRYLSDCVVLRR